MDLVKAKSALFDAIIGVETLQDFFVATCPILGDFIGSKIAAVYNRRATRNNSHITPYFWEVQCEYPIKDIIQSFGFPGPVGNYSILFRRTNGRIDKLMERCAMEKQCMCIPHGRFMYVLNPVAVHPQGSSHVIYVFVITMRESQDIVKFFTELQYV